MIIADDIEFITYFQPKPLTFPRILRGVLKLDIFVDVFPKIVSDFKKWGIVFGPALDHRYIYAPPKGKDRQIRELSYIAIDNNRYMANIAIFSGLNSVSKSVYKPK